MVIAEGGVYVDPIRDAPARFVLPVRRRGYVGRAGRHGAEGYQRPLPVGVEAASLLSSDAAPPDLLYFPVRSPSAGPALVFGTGPMVPADVHQHKVHMLLRHLATLALSITIFLLVSVLSAQTDSAATLGIWKEGGSASLTFSQVGMKNWAGGGQNTIAVGGLASLFATMKDGLSEWSNTFDGGYGFTKLGESDFRKSDDKLILVSKYGYRFAEDLLGSALLELRSQFTDGFNYDRFDSVTGDYQRISRFLAPGYFMLGVGVTWKPADYFEVLLAPVSNRAIIVLDDTLSAQGAYGVDPGENFKSEFGSLLSATFKKELVTNVALASRLSVFAPYQEFTTMVVNWESLFTMKVNDYINASLGVDFIYDSNVSTHRDDGTVGPRLQFRDVIGIGLGYRF